MASLSGEWRKSSFCSYGDCLEIRSVATEILGDIVEIRSSTRHTVVVRCTADEWNALMDGVRGNEFGV